MSIQSAHLRGGISILILFCVCTAIYCSLIIFTVSASGFPGHHTSVFFPIYLSLLSIIEVLVSYEHQMSSEKHIQDTLASQRTLITMDRIHPPTIPTIHTIHTIRTIITILQVPTTLKSPTTSKSLATCTIPAASLIPRHNLETPGQLRNGAQRTRIPANLDSLMESQRRLEVQHCTIIFPCPRCYNLQLVRWKVEHQEGGSFSATTLCNDVESAGERCHIGQTHCFLPARSTLGHLPLTRQQTGEVRGRTSSTPPSLPCTASALVLGKR